MTRLPVPAPQWSSGKFTFTLDDTRAALMREAVRLTPWQCLYCRTVQPVSELRCANCGAPRIQPEADA